MNLIKIENPNFIDDNLINIISDYITSGKIAILPTSTLYGISCSYKSKKSIERVYEIKKREGNLPFIILISDISIISNLAQEITESAKKIINHYWLSRNPEPLTLIFKRNKSLKPFITSGSNNIAIRLDGLKLLRRVIDISGPIISTSANISGNSILPSAIEDIPDKIRNMVDLVVDYGKKLPGTASTIIDVTGAKPVIIREGKIKYSDILKV
jgi:L-threonylcarbamoyladenylate synthase